MQNIPFTYARKKLKDTIDYVCDNSEPVLITRGNKPAAVLMSLEDYKSYDETAYLMSNPANAKHLLESMEQIKRGEIEQHDLIEE